MSKRTTEFETWAVADGYAYRNQHGFWFYRNGGDGLFDAWAAGVLHAKCEAVKAKDGAGAKRKGSTESSGPDASLISLSLDSPEEQGHPAGRASEPSNGGTGNSGA